MRTPVLVVAVALTFLVSGTQGAVVATRVPVLVELFTSEGCSSCPPADALLQSLAETQPVAGAEIVALGQHVDYWDRLGWKDRFSSSALTSRQREYGRALHVDSIYTPQIVVDGQAELVGSDTNGARRAIAKAVSEPHASLSIAIEAAGGDRLAVSASAADLPKLSRADRADFVLAVTESALRSDVRAGENKGRVLTHAAVVRELKTMGEAAGLPLSARTEVGIAPGWQRDHVTIVVFVQERASRRVLGSAAAPLSSARR